MVVVVVVFCCCLDCYVKWLKILHSKVQPTLLIHSHSLHKESLIYLYLYNKQNRSFARSSRKIKNEPCIFSSTDYIHVYAICTQKIHGAK